MRPPLLLLLAISVTSSSCGGATAPSVPASELPKPGVTDPRDNFLESPNELIRAPQPRGEGWTCEASHIDNQERALRADIVSCVKQVGNEEVLRLIAKDYEVQTAKSIPSAEALATEVYAPQWRRLLDQVEERRKGPLEHAGHASYELELEGETNSGRRDRIIDRVIVAGRHTVGLQAVGQPAAIDEARAEINEWFARVEFASLKQ
jgi:hypothetical protein